MPKLNPRWLDRMYNNRALVPDHARHLGQWAEASDDARDAHSHQLDIAYGDGPMETLDVFPAKVKKGAPVVVFIHGGYWRSLDKSDHAITLPQIVMQMVKALAWTYRNARKYGGNPNHITVIGHSAGGHLATMLLACAWPVYAKGLPVDLVKNALSISGLYDLEPIRQTPFLQESLKLTPEQVLLCSPAWMPRPRQGELYAVAGGDESAEFLRHNTMIQTAWGKKIVPVCATIPGRNHFSVLEDLTAPWERLHQLASKLVLR
jgi:arylformamidase